MLKCLGFLYPNGKLEFPLQLGRTRGMIVVLLVEYVVLFRGQYKKYVVHQQMVMQHAHNRGSSVTTYALEHWCRRDH